MYAFIVFASENDVGWQIVVKVYLHIDSSKGSLDAIWSIKATAVKFTKGIPNCCKREYATQM